MKKTLIVLYIVVVAVMAAATIVENNQGTEFVSENIYGAWWFSALWALLAAAGIFWFVKSKVRRPSIVVLHLSFLVILAGALLTHLTAVQGLDHFLFRSASNLFTILVLNRPILIHFFCSFPVWQVFLPLISD